MGEQEQWQLDASAPELYQRYLVPAVTAMWAADLAGRAALLPGHRVLDVACGTGAVARVAAERVGGAGRVAGLDINPGMLAVARSLPAVAGARSRGTAAARSRCPSRLRCSTWCSASWGCNSSRIGRPRCGKSGACWPPAGGWP